jgi:hypothetical protein
MTLDHENCFTPALQKAIIESPIGSGCWDSIRKTGVRFCFGFPGD